MALVFSNSSKRFESIDKDEIFRYAGSNMKIVPIKPNRPDPRYLREAVEVLRRGGLVVYPTETAYALGCDSTNPKALRQIYKVKGRSLGKQLPLIVTSLIAARRAAVFNAEALRLARRYWPGPLTLVLPERSKSKRRTVALRVSPHPIARALAARLGRPIVSTSANRSGEPTKYTIISVIHDLGLKPDFVLDAGTLKWTPPSTIIGFEKGQPKVLRSGPINL